MLIAVVADCPRCHNAIVVRRRRSDGSQFVGCEAWSSDSSGCKFTAPFDQLTQALGERIDELQEQLAMATLSEGLLEAEVAELRARHHDPRREAVTEPQPGPRPRVRPRPRRRRRAT